MGYVNSQDICNTLGLRETPTRPSLSLETELMLAEGCRGQRVSQAQAKALLLRPGCRSRREGKQSVLSQDRLPLKCLISRQTFLHNTPSGFPQSPGSQQELGGAAIL